ncbi:MAG: ROK family protein [Mycobacteriales bacterium]
MAGVTAVAGETVLALDIGGTKIAGAVVGIDGEIRRRERIATPPGDPWPALSRLLDRLAERQRVVGIGVGCGGPLRWPAGEVSPLNIPAWRHFPLRARLAERVPGVPVRVHNDAVAFAAGEHWRGAGRGVTDLLGVVVSTGVGGGLILADRLVDGPSGNGGHVGHVVADPAGPACVCGGRGCLEAIARGPATVAWARERGSSAADGRALATAAASGEPVALAALARAGRAAGTVVASVAALLDLRLVVIGGGLAASGEAFWQPLRTAFGEQARLPFLTATRVVPSGLGDDAGLVGAAALVLAGDRYWSGGGERFTLGR